MIIVVLWLSMYQYFKVKYLMLTYLNDKKFIENYTKMFINIAIVFDIKDG